MLKLRRPKVRVPLWLKILVIIFLLSALLPVLQPMQAVPSVLGLVLVGVLIRYPGPDPARPRLLKFLPWLWILELFASLAILVSRFSAESHGTPLPPEFENVSWLEIATSVAGTPILLYFYVKSHPIFPKIMLGLTAIQVIESLRKMWDPFDSGVETLPSWTYRVDSLVAIVTGIWALVYIQKKWPAWTAADSATSQTGS